MVITTGLPELNSLIGELQVGDNVVWEVEGRVEHALTPPFVATSTFAGLVYVIFTESATFHCGAAFTTEEIEEFESVVGS